MKEIKWIRGAYKNIRTQFSDDDKYLIDGGYHHLTLYILVKRKEGSRFYKPVAQSRTMKELKKIANIHNKGGDITPYTMGQTHFYLSITPFPNTTTNGAIWSLKEEI